MNATQARNVVLTLQADPFAYRNFGVWWWHVKSELKRNGFTRDNLQHLGDYCDDGAVEHYYDGMTLDDLDREAFAVNAVASVSGDSGNPLSTTPDGELYLLQDADVE